MFVPIIESVLGVSRNGTANRIMFNFRNMSYEVQTKEFYLESSKDWEITVLLKSPDFWRSGKIIIN